MNVSTVAMTIGISGSQKSQWKDRLSAIGPARITPRPPPTPSSADMSPMPPATRARGNSSRMIPKASGKIPPAAPWMTRASSITARVVESAASTVPAVSSARTITSSRCLPNMSPSFPISGVATEALSR